VQSESMSAFGQVEVPLGETLTAVGGLRYTDNQRDAVYLNGGFGFNRNADIFAGTTPPPGGAPDSYIFNAGPARKDFALMRYRQTLNLGSDDSKVTWLLGLNWQPNPDTLLYAKVSTGFKGGGFDAVGTYGPESNLAYEAGGKFTFGSQGQFQLNLGGFYYDYTGLQVSVLLDTTVGGQTFNAGAATIWGLEAEGVFELTDNTVFDFSVNYLDATYDELFAQFNVFCVGGCALNGIGDLDPTTAGVQQPNFAGNSAPFSPKVIVRAGLQHTFDFGEDGNITAGIATTLKSSYFTDFYNYNDGRQGSLTQTDLSLEWRNESDSLGVQFYARNLENERALTYGSFVSAGPDDIYNWQFGTPTTFGLRLSLDY
jgi:iron complex outermembrane receptor protein